MAARRPGSAGGCGTLLGVLLLIGLAILIIKWALITAAILAVPFGIWWVLDRSTQSRQAREVQARARRREEIESRAVVDAAWGCGWCGSRIAHHDAAGTLVMPREYHRDEIDDAIALVERPSF